MKKYNYHTHTKRCGHAVGEDEEYVIAAINNGYKILGFSDHVFIPNLLNPDRIRGNFDELDNYLYSLNYLKQKYKDQIEIFIGFECEYFPELEDYYRDLLKSKKVDYLILGQHYAYYENNLLFDYVPYSKNRDERYVELIEQGLNTGLFSILVHPDLYLASQNMNEKNVKLAERICKSCLDNDVYLEFNQGGLRRGQVNIDNEMRYPYPVKDFFMIAKEFGNKIVMGVDAHAPSELFHPVARVHADSITLDWGIKIVDEVKLKKVY